MILPAKSDRQRIYGHLNYFGLRTVANIVQALGLDEQLVRKCLVELKDAGYVRPITDAAGTVYAEVVPGKRYDDAYVEFKLAQTRQRDAQLEAEQAAGDERSEPSPPATSHASLPPGPHMPPVRRRRSYSPTTNAASRKADNECKSPSHQRIVATLRQHGKLARFEIIQLTGLPSGSVDARCNELLAAGYLIETGETRMTPHNTPAGVLALNPAKPYPFC